MVWQGGQVHLSVSELIVAKILVTPPHLVTMIPQTMVTLTTLTQLTQLHQPHHVDQSDVEDPGVVEQLNIPISSQT